MSMHLEFNPHSWYKGAAIQKASHTPHRADNLTYSPECNGYEWSAYYFNGMTGYIVEFAATTLTDLKRQITEYINTGNERDALNRARLGE